ncbi:MAG TPA: protein kinase [Candidatus Acidoferrum sp.]
MKVCPNCQRSYPTGFAVCPQDGVQLTEPSEWSPGSVIRGKYRILSKIGEGGMGSVYKAVHIHFNELCALKVMSPHLLNDKNLVKRFGREAIFARKLRHKNAVRVEDFDETEDNRPFIVMEYVEGKSLKSLMQSEGPLPVPRVCSIIKQAAAALDAAHQIGLVHRDIKPDNIILVSSDGREVAKVLDFGIAKFNEGLNTTSDMSLTGTGMLMGTPPYMSPEQAKGASGDKIDGRSDLYSLGIVMYQMLTGELPLKAETPLHMLFAHIQTPPTPIHSVRPELTIPGPIAALVMKCLEKQRERRPQSGRALIEELEHWESGLQNTLPAVFQQEETETSPGRQQPREVPLPALEEARAADAGLQARDRATPKSYQGERREPVRSPVSPRSVEQPEAAQKPAREIEAKDEASARRDAPRSGRTWIFFFAILLVGALGGGGWYFYRSGRLTDQQKPASDGNAGAAGLEQPAVTGPNSASPSAGQGVAPNPPPAASSGQERPSGGPANSSRNTPQLSEAEKTDRSKKANAARTLGDLYYENGNYDDAIKEYQMGLQADPKNKALRDRLALAKHAKAVTQGGRN